MRDDEPITPADIDTLEFEELAIFDVDDTGSQEFVSSSAAEPDVRSAAASATMSENTGQKAKVPGQHKRRKKKGGGNAVMWCFAIAIGIGLVAMLVVMLVAGQAEDSFPSTDTQSHPNGHTTANQAGTGGVSVSELYEAFGHRLEGIESSIERQADVAADQAGLLTRMENAMRDLRQSITETVASIGALDQRMSEVERDIVRLDGLVGAIEANASSARQPATAQESPAEQAAASASGGLRAWRVIGVMEDRAFVRDVATGDYQSVEPGSILAGAGRVQSINSHSQCAVTLEDGTRICNNRIER